MLKDRAKDWFVVNTLSHLIRESIISWIIALKIIFSMNLNAWGITQDRKYDSSNDNLVIDYFYNKVNLLKIIDEKIDDDDIKKSIWHDLSSKFQFIFDYDKI